MTRKMIRPWSISTAVRNPDRARGFLQVLSQMDGRTWDKSAQVEFQARLLQARLYGVFNKQFYRGLEEARIRLLESEAEISLCDALAILDEKSYVDLPMRGRNSFKVLHRLGFASNTGGVLRITDSGHAFLSEENDYEGIFLRCFMKWQLPNPLDESGFPRRDGYNIKPFVGVLHLIREVNRLCKREGMPVKGLTPYEFQFFALTLIDWRKIKEAARDVVSFRRAVEGAPLGKREGVAHDLAQSMRPHFNLQHCRDYADNAIRYFRVTKLLRLRGWGDHIDIAPTRRVEIDSLLNRDSGAPEDFASETAFNAYYLNPDLPELPGETQRELLESVLALRGIVERKGGAPGFALNRDESREQLKLWKTALREQVRALALKESEERLSLPEGIRRCAEDLRALIKMRGKENRAVELERLVTEGLRALNDALEIRPNHPLSDDGQPVYTAPAGKPDIECFYVEFAMICEVTLLTSRNQWFNEGQPVMRHLRAFEDANSESDCYCIFVAPSLHQDTVNTFWNSVRYEYQGERQKIAPMTVEQFCQILDFCAERKSQEAPLTRQHIYDMLARISELADNVSDSRQWIARVPEILRAWKQHA